MWGETVLVRYADGSEESVDNVLVQQTDATDLTVLDVQTRFINQARYKGDTQTLTLCWPKTHHDDDLNNAYVTVRGNKFRVYSSPMPYDHTVCGTMWDRLVTVMRSLFLYDIELISAVSTVDEFGVWSQTFSSRSVKANLLRRAESLKYDAGIREPDELAMVEVPLEDYNGEMYIGYLGQRYLVTETAYSNDTIVMTCIASGVVM